MRHPPSPFPRFTPRPTLPLPVCLPPSLLASLYLTSELNTLTHPWQVVVRDARREYEERAAAEEERAAREAAPEPEWKRARREREEAAAKAGPAPLGVELERPQQR